MVRMPISSSARCTGYVPGGARTAPNPIRNVSRSSTVMDRSAGTVSSSSDSIVRST